MYVSSNLHASMTNMIRLKRNIQIHPCKNILLCGSTAAPTLALYFRIFDFWQFDCGALNFRPFNLGLIRPMYLIPFYPGFF